MDADACPRGAKELLYRTADREAIEVILVANNPLKIPRSPWIDTLVVAHGFDVADHTIIDKVAPGDLVITADIPLAAEIVDRGALGINPRGGVYSVDNVKQKLASRNLLASLRDEGLMGGGPPPFGPKDKHRFASTLHRELQKLKRDASQS